MTVTKNDREAFARYAHDQMNEEITRQRPRARVGAVWERSRRTVLFLCRDD